MQFPEQFPIHFKQKITINDYLISQSQIIMLSRNFGKIKAFLLHTQYPFQNAYKKSQSQSSTNPFQLKSLHELEKMIDSLSSQRNGTFASGLILKAVTGKLAVPDAKITEQDRFVDRSIIINKCLWMAFCHIQEIGYQGLFDIAQVFRHFEDSKNVQIDEKNYRFFIEKFPIKICELTKQGQRQNMKELQKILFSLIQVRKKGILLNKLIYFIMDHGLDDKNQIIQFLAKLLHFNHVEKLIKRYIDNLALSSKDSHASIQDCDSIILQTIRNSSIIFKSIYHLEIKEYVYWLIRQTKKNTQMIDVDRKIKIMTEVINYFHYLPVHILQQQIVRIRQHLEFMQWLFLSICKESQSLQKLEKAQFQNFIRAIIAYQSLKEIDLWGFHGTPVNYYKHSKDLLNLFCLQIIQNADRYSPQQTVSLINQFCSSGLILDQEIQNKFIQFILNFLQTLNFSKLLLPTIRVFQFIAFKIGKSKKEAYIFKVGALLKKVEKTVKNLRSYEIIRLYAVSMHLNIESLQIKEYFWLNIEKNEAKIVQNLSRTILKKQSLPLIREICEQAIVKYKQKQNSPKNSINKCNIISFSLRGSKLNLEDENDEMFKFWFQRHWNFTRQVFRNQKAAQYIIRYINKELSKSYFSNTIKIQLQIQAFQIFRSQINDQQQLKVIQTNFQELLRPLLKLQRYHEPITSKRYSLFPKLVWLYKLNLGKLSTVKEQHRFKCVMKQLLLFSREDKTLDIINFHSLNKRLILSMIKQKIDQSIQGLSSMILQFWFWANHNSFLDSEPMFKQNHLQIFNQCLKISRKTGSQFQILEFCLGNTHIQNNAFKEIIEDINSSWKWYQQLNGRVSKDITSEDALELLGFRNIIRYFGDKNHKFTDFLFQKIMEAEYCIGYIKYLEVYKVIKSFGREISEDLKLKTDKYLQKQLLSLKELEPQRYPQVFIKSQQFKRVDVIPQEIHHYLSTNLRNGNYYSISQYIELSQICLAQDIQVLMNLLKINRSLVYMLQLFPLQCFDLIDNLLSLVVLKEDHLLIQKFMSEYLGIMTEIDLGEISENKKIEFMMKLKVACSLVNESIDKKIGQLSKITDQSIISYIHLKQKQIIQKEGLDIPTSAFYEKTKINNLFLFKNPKNYVLLSDGTKKSDLETMYLKLHFPEISCVHYRQLLSVEL